MMQEYWWYRVLEVFVASNNEFRKCLWHHSKALVEIAQMEHCK